MLSLPMNISLYSKRAPIAVLITSVGRAGHARDPRVAFAMSLEILLNPLLWRVVRGGFSKDMKHPELNGCINDTGWFNAGDALTCHSLQ